MSEITIELWPNGNVVTMRYSDDEILNDDQRERLADVFMRDFGIAMMFEKSAGPCGCEDDWTDGTGICGCCGKTRPEYTPKPSIRPEQCTKYEPMGEVTA